VILSFDDSVLSEFRSRLVAGGAELRRLVVLLDQCQVRGWRDPPAGESRTDSTHVRASVRADPPTRDGGRNAAPCAAAVLAEVARAWLRDQITPDWFDRYGHRVEDYRLPKGKEARGQHALLIGADGLQRLSAVEAESAPPHFAREALYHAAETRPGSNNTCRGRGRSAGKPPRSWRPIFSARIHPTTQKPWSSNKRSTSLYGL
jgi:hypothetical protein